MAAGSLINSHPVRKATRSNLNCIRLHQTLLNQNFSKRERFGVLFKKKENMKILNIKKDYVTFVISRIGYVCFEKIQKEPFSVPHPSSY